MTVTVLYFAALRDLLGRSEEQLALPANLLLERVAEPGQGARHGADLVRTRGRDRNIEISRV